MSTRRHFDYKGFRIVATCCAEESRPGASHSANFTVESGHTGSSPPPPLPQPVFISCETAIEHAFALARKSIDRIEAVAAHAEQ